MIKTTALLAIITGLLILSGCNNNKQNACIEPFRLADVQITDGLFYKAQQTDLEYLLALDPDRLLAPYFKDAGLKPIKDNYPNWENTGLDGHIGGHYLSAMSFMYAATGNAEVLQRINYMIKWLKRCQNKNGNGYVGGVPYGQKTWKEVSEGKINAATFSLNDKWVPLYNIHKLFAGLYDVYINTGNYDAKQILINLTNWFALTTKNLTNEQVQTMLVSEHGGLNDVFTDVAALTGDNKYLELAKRFSHIALLTPLIQQQNQIEGLHANTQIPKVIGFEKYAQATGNKEWKTASEFFWSTVVSKFTISIGGNSVREHFHPANDFSTMVESEQGPETCNTYNMLKLTRLLFLANPQQKYINYYERALFNHILSTEHPDKGGFVYFTPMRPRHYRVYSQPQTSFWCCVGSGLENPGKYGELIYAKSNNTIWANMFISSKVTWHNKELTVEQKTGFPYSQNTSFIIVTNKPKKFTLKIRNPNWVIKNSGQITINGKSANLKPDNNGYYNIKRRWHNNDTVFFSFDMQTYAEYLPDSSPWVSFIHGPIVLGAITDTTNLVGLWADDSRMGHVANGPKYPLNKAPAIIIDSTQNITSVITPVDKSKLLFRLGNLTNTDTNFITLQPFYSIHEARYMVYWPVYTKTEYLNMQAGLALKEQELNELERRTVDLVCPGEQQPEADHFVKFSDSRTGIFKSRHWRHASGFISYQFKNPGKKQCLLRVTYYGADKNRNFNIIVNNQVIANQVLDGTMGEKFVDIDYKIPQQVINLANGNPVEIKFAPAPGSLAGGFFGIRLMTVD